VRLHALALQPFTYIRSNRSAIADYGKRYRAGLQVATTLAQSAVSSRGKIRLAGKVTENASAALSPLRPDFHLT
jgi:hypothetical protein